MSDATPAAARPPEADASAVDTRKEQSRWFRYYRTNGRAMNAFLTLVIVWAVFAVNNPPLFLNPVFYNAFLFSVPATIFLTTSLVFVIVSGELDLAFPSVVGAAGGVFMYMVMSGFPVMGAFFLTLGFGALLGAGIGLIVVYGKISSLVATLGLNFFILGLVNLLAQGRTISAPDAVGTLGNRILTGKFELLNTGLQVPMHFVWSLLWCLFCFVLFKYHKFGVRVQLVGDNTDSARQMGINVERIRVGVFIFSGIAAAIAGAILVQMANMVWFPTSGKAYLLIALAALFVGGTPTWGGVGTIWGALFGAMTVTLIPSGAVGAGFAGYWTDFLFGLVIILTMIAHRFSGARVR
ncbi:ABC transporter permease [Histidinibacterium lentulum]|uniref:Autoinducer 2 import system permease protein LsrC n=1 Tax=Histidinibacterium lentulum TaxID=2480588 RepID=A0A3N2R5A9_9RHOB|nr:ABC transporter permease [Histidinibacterium lentulum]ROU02578.1 ABC transporter permease [Histidinibacterium lentulum]